MGRTRTLHVLGQYFPKDGCKIVDSKTNEIIATVHERDGAREIANVMAASLEMKQVLELAIRYLDHPDVKAITDRMALPGSAVRDRIPKILRKAETVQM